MEATEIQTNVPTQEAEDNCKHCGKAIVDGVCAYPDGPLFCDEGVPRFVLRGGHSMIETLYMKAGGVQLRLRCAQCLKTAFFDSGTKTLATKQAKYAGWRFLRGDVFCGERCNVSAKETVR